MVWQAVLGLAGAVTSLTVTPATDGPMHSIASVQTLSGTVAGMSLAPQPGALAPLVLRSSDTRLELGSGFGVQSIAVNTGYGSVVQSAVSVTANVNLTTQGAALPQ